MILLAFTIYDRKALQYHAPFFAVTDGAALRSFTDVANDPQTNIGRHPGDFVLYRCGAWDDHSGAVLPGQLEHISDALPLVRTQHPLPFDLGRPQRSDTNGAAGPQELPTEGR